MLIDRLSGIEKFMTVMGYTLLSLQDKQLKDAYEHIKMYMWSRDNSHNNKEIAEFRPDR